MTRLGPDASGVGWVFQYALVDESGKRDSGELRTLHDFSIRYALASVEGVAEIATIGGLEPEYQITVDPGRLRTYGLSLADVSDAVRRAIGDVGGRLIEMSEREYFVRGRGYVGSVADLEAVAVRTDARGTPVADIEQGHTSTASCILANLALKLGRTLAWDAKAGKVADDDEANRLLRRPYREPWVHPEPRGA